MRSIDDENDELADLDNDEVSVEDSLGPAFAKLVEKAKAKGVVSVDEVNMAISAEQGPEAIEEAMTILSDLDIHVVEKDDEENSDDAIERNDDEDSEDELANLGRTNDPVRMYLREMGIVVS